MTKRFIPWLAGALAILLLSASAFGQMPVPANQMLVVVGGGGCGAGTFTHIQDKADQSVGGGTTFSLGSWTISAGNLVTVWASWDATGTHTATVADSLGNTYSPSPAGRRGPSSNGQYIEAFTSTITNAGSGFITLTMSSSTGSLVIYANEWHLSSGTFAFDQEVYNAPGGASASPTSTALTPACNNSILVSGVEGNANIAADTGSGWTATAATSGFFQGEWLIQTTAASKAATYTQTSGNYGAGMLIFKPQ